MGRGIQRVVVQFREGEVRVRTQSKSLRGTPYTVGHTSEACTPGDKKSQKSATEAAILRLLPKLTITT